MCLSYVHIENINESTVERDISSLEEEEEEEEAQCSVVKVVVDVLLLILTGAVVFGYILTKNNRLSISQFNSY